MEENKLTTEKEALNYINKYGFVTLFPIKGIVFPSLYQAAKGDREQKFNNTWKWADNLAQKKLIHYGKLIRKQVTLISLEMFPYFYKVYRGSKFSGTPRKILEFLKRHGPASTTSLRKELNLMGKAKKGEFTKAMDELQLAFAIAIVDREVLPKMTYTWDILERWMPEELLMKAEAMSAPTAKEKIIDKLMESKLIATRGETSKLLGSTG